MNGQNSLNDEICTRMNREIMDLTLAPGRAVSVQKLADAYGVSRTPVREAVIRLERKGLVEIYPQSKTVISRISLKRIGQERFLRRALETAAVEPFLQNCGEDTLCRMESLLAASRPGSGNADSCKDFFSADNEFHRIIFETAGQSLCWDTINDVVSHYNRFRFLSTRIKDVNRGILDEHEKILNAAKEKNAREMRRMLDLHLGKIELETEKLLALYPEYFVAE